MGKKVLKLLLVGASLFTLELVYGVASNLISGSQLVKKFVHKVELFCGVNILEKKPLIANFQSSKKSYEISENIRFKLKLKNDAFVYLLNISNQHPSLLFPNDIDPENYYIKSKIYQLPLQTYNIYANNKSTEQFYLIASEIKLSFKGFSKLSKSEAKERIEDLKKSCLVDVYRLDIDVK